MDIEKLAREAGLGESLGSWCQECGIKDEQIRRFAALVVEECAKACERQASLQVNTGGSEDAVNQALRCARDIRAQVPPESAVSAR